MWSNVAEVLRGQGLRMLYDAGQKGTDGTEVGRARKGGWRVAAVVLGVACLANRESTKPQTNWSLTHLRTGCSSGDWLGDNASVVGRLLLILLAVLIAVGAFAYGLESPARYDAAAATYFYPRRPHRDLVLAAGIVCSVAVLLLAWPLERLRSTLRTTSR